MSAGAQSPHRLHQAQHHSGKKKFSAGRCKSDSFVKVTLLPEIPAQEAEAELTSQVQGQSGYTSAETSLGYIARTCIKNKQLFK